MKHLLETKAAEQWKSLGLRHFHGINLALFSLWSENSLGIGEFFDLLGIIDLCEKSSIDIIQLLPLNDTGPCKSPYSAVSAFALNPLFLSLQGLEGFDKLDSEKIEALKKLNHSQFVDYENVFQIKWPLLKAYARKLQSVQESRQYQAFLADKPWLESYSLFMTLKEKLGWKCWTKWPKALRQLGNENYKELVATNAEEIKIHQILQFLCFEQLKTVKEYAEKKNVYLKGDIPILLSFDSADVWYDSFQDTQIFLRDLSAGAPPDMYSKNGQNWGFPLYDWHCLEGTDFAWWKKRLDYASHFYHLYRIDHIVGFFRIWAIEKNTCATKGFFLPFEEEKYLKQGKKIMEMMLSSCKMLPIGEDLGTVPCAVRSCLKELGICGSKVLRWERKWNEEGQPFIDINQYPLESMSTVSTHDSEPLGLWWKTQKKEAESFAKEKGWQYQEILSKEQCHAILKDCHQSASLFHINLLQEYLYLFDELHWPKIEDERINIPGKVLKKNWSYRYRQSVETLKGHKGLQKLFQDLSQKKHGL